MKHSVILTYSHKYGSISLMRTTVDIPDPLYRELKGKAASEGRSVKELILRGVEQELRGQRRRRGRVALPIVPSKRPGSLKLDNAKIFEIIPFP
jgi:hypothetical protein